MPYSYIDICYIHVSFYIFISFVSIKIVFYLFLILYLPCLFSFTFLQCVGFCMSNVLSTIFLNILFGWLFTTLCSTLSIIRKIYEYLFLLDVCLEILFLSGYG